MAINKIDKPGANPERVIVNWQKAWGYVKSLGVAILEFVNPQPSSTKISMNSWNRPSCGWNPTKQIQPAQHRYRYRSTLDKGKVVATLLVQQGTLTVQDPTVVGATLTSVPWPMTAVVVSVAGTIYSSFYHGLNEAPPAGDHFCGLWRWKICACAGEESSQRALMKQRQATNRVSSGKSLDTLKAGEVKPVNVIIKADVQGSPFYCLPSKIEVEGVKVTIVHPAVGAISESDDPLCRSFKCLHHRI